MRLRRGTTTNHFDTRDPDGARWSPARWILGLGCALNVLVGVWLLEAASEAEGAWSVGWRAGLAVLLGAGALVFAAGAVIGLADRRRSLS